MRLNRGLSLLEILLAFLIIFLVSLYCMSMFAQGQRHWLRAQEYSVATFLVNEKMQELLAVPGPELTSGAGTFPVPFEDYRFAVTARPFEHDLVELRVEVVSRQGARSGAACLVADNERFFGVAVDPSTNLVAFSRGDQTISYWDDQTRALAPAIPDRPDGAVGAVAGLPGHNKLWSAGVTQSLRALREFAPNPREWLGAVPAPLSPAAGVADPRYSGLATDASCSYVFLGDAANRAIFLLVDDSAPTWQQGSITATNPPLGAPAGLATDDHASLLWVADREYQCLRKLLLVPGKYPAAQYEQAAFGWWHRTQFRPGRAVGVLGDPQGIAMDPNGWAVYVTDRGRLWRFTEGEATPWVVMAEYPADLVAAGPCGLALDDYDNVIYLSTRLGQLWKCTLAQPPAASTCNRLL